MAYARHAERIEEAYAGHVTDPHITTLLRARYDVVTLLQRRSPAPDPAAELNAALTLLRPGGLLLVEAAPPEAHGLRAQLESQGCDDRGDEPSRPGPAPAHCRIIARRTASAA